MLCIHGFTGTPAEVRIGCEVAESLGLASEAPCLAGHGASSADLALTTYGLAITGGDTLMRDLLFWSMFLPLGRAWSLDTRGWTAGHAAGEQKPIVSVASAAILLQVCLMYWFTAIFKFEAGWPADSGLQNALAWGGYNRPLGDVLLRWPTLMYALSIATLWLEFVGFRRCSVA